MEVCTINTYTLKLRHVYCSCTYTVGVPQAIMLEYPLHGRFHSFLVLKRKSALSGNTQHWPGWTRRNSQGKVVKVSCVRCIYLPRYFTVCVYVYLN